MRPRRPLPAGAARPALAACPAHPDDVLVDTGVLVALFNRADGHHAAAASWMSRCQGQLHTVEPVLSETAFFVPPHLRAQLADLAARRVLQVHAPNAAGHDRMAQLFTKYRSLDPDWADLELVWLAESSGIARIATLDGTDFSVYRIHGRKRFQLELLR